MTDSAKHRVCSRKHNNKVPMHYESDKMMSKQEIEI